MTIRTLIRPLLVLAALAVAGPAAAATLQVSASVGQNCTITALPVLVGSYDPIVANDTAPVANASGTLTVRCTKGTSYWVTLDNGTNFDGAAPLFPGRSMKHDTLAEYLNYELYTDAGRTAVWNTSTAATAGSRAPILLTVYARVPGGQDVPEGTYTDTVTATVNF
jgi:spore coat protein U-like protein